jgi:hypothetical protein
MIQNNGWYRLKTTTHHLTLSNISFVKKGTGQYFVRLSRNIKKTE